MTPDPAKSACVLHASFSVRICGWFDLFCHQDIYYVEFIHNGQIDVWLKFVRLLFQPLKDSNGGSTQDWFRTSGASEAMTSKRLLPEDAAADIFCQ